MTRIILLAAAVASIALAAPALAQDVVTYPGACAQFYPDANCTNKGQNSPYNGDYQRRGGVSGPLGYNSGLNSYDSYTGPRRSDRANRHYPR